MIIINERTSGGIMMRENQNSYIELDVREDLRLNKEPFQKIMNAVKSLDHDQAFILHAPFKPFPLFKIMERRGFTYEAEKIGHKHWVVTFRHRGGEGE